MMNLLFPIVLSTISATLGAIVATRLALSRFYRERIWERKYQTYISTARAIHDINRDLLVSLDYVDHGLSTSDEFYEKISLKQREAWEEIAANASLGDFLLSPEAAGLLDRLIKSWETVGSPEDYMLKSVLTARISLTSEILEKFKSEGLRDTGRTPRIRIAPMYISVHSKS